MAIDRRAVAVETQGNHGEIAIARFTWHIALVAIFDTLAEQRTRGLEVARIGIDDGEVCRGQEFPQNQRRPGKDPTADNDGATNVLQLRKESSKSSSVMMQNESL